MSLIDEPRAVLAANRRFYEAFEARDLDAMSDLWERSERSTCTHPGWATLRGWGRIASSFFALFQGPQSLQFVLTEERAQIVGDVGWVSVDENLLGAQGGATVAALNVFVRDSEGEWRLVCHHGSVVTSQIEVEAGGASDAQPPN
ncbi:MAG TPA: nuclear transport factor 2 family protein [Acidimicrobiales bacterium]|nr:nuclear transport factor 2 family protein [Acidimicrobiales bacterium]